ncbi:MAG: HlyD family efflux transporter periplasmic adaptor subunit [Planctomycetaceae bacterium]
MSQIPLFSNGDLSWETPVRLRPDLQISPIQRGSYSKYVIKDPVSLSYFEFDEHEFALLQRLDGRTGWDELRRWFNRRFPPLKLTHRALQAMIWRLYRQGLLVSGAAGQGGRSADRVRNETQRSRWRMWSQPWVIRLPGFDPGPLVDLAAGLFGWVFAPGFVGLAIPSLLMIVAMAVSRTDALFAMGPTAAEFLAGKNLAILAVAVVGAKICHELGHAVAARRFGCDCHEMGILLLAGLPSLYCDVSDAWMLPRRWERIVISLAGIWVELLLAGTAFVLWFASVPGLVHACSFNVMVACSLGTLLFNANPLVRYDGYYVLMDLTNVPNLGQRANESLVRGFARWVLGSDEQPPLDEPELPGWCVAYGVAAAIYRIFLTCAILWGLHWVLKPYAADGLLVIVVATAITSAAVGLSKSSAQQFRRAAAQGASAWRMTAGLIIASGLLAGCWFIPLPWYVLGEALLEPADRQIVTAQVPGKLSSRDDPGTKVEEGSVVARLENRDLQREQLRLEAELSTQNRHLQTLLSRRNQDPRASEEIPGAQAAVAAVEHRLTYLQEEIRRLELHSPVTATIYPAAERLAALKDDELPTWSGSLLDPVNQDAWVDANDSFCQIGSSERLEAIAVLAQDDLEAVRVGQRADVFLRAAGRSLRGEVASISRLEADAREELTVARLLPEEQLPGGRQPLTKWYQVQIRCLEPCPPGTVLRSQAKVRIQIGSRTLGDWITLQFYKTFRWRA